MIVYWPPPTKKRVFLSFRVEDKNQVQGVRLLAATPKFDLEFYDESVTEPINSKNAEYIKQKIRDKIYRSSVTLCLISKDTYKSDWVNWEIEESLKKGKKVIVMALKGVERAILPRTIKDANLDFWEWDPNLLSGLLSEE